MAEAAREPWDITGEGYFELYSGPTKVLDGYFLEGVRVTPNYETVVSRSPGSAPVVQSFRDLIGFFIHQLFCRKADQFFKPTDGNTYTAKLLLINRDFSGVSPEEQDTFTITGVALDGDQPIDFPLGQPAIIDLNFTGTDIS